MAPPHLCNPSPSAAQLTRVHVASRVPKAFARHSARRRLRPQPPRRVGRRTQACLGGAAAINFFFTLPAHSARCRRPLPAALRGGKPLRALVLTEPSPISERRGVRAPNDEPPGLRPMHLACRRHSRLRATCRLLASFLRVALDDSVFLGQAGPSPDLPHSGWLPLPRKCAAW